MAVSLEQFRGRVDEVLAQLELYVLDGLSELSFDAANELSQRVPLELIQAQRSLREASLALSAEKAGEAD